jgi:LysR family transcriptional activator of nhaA
LRDLMVQLRSHSIDLVLSNQSLKRDSESTHQSHLLDEQPVSLVLLC